MSALSDEKRLTLGAWVTFTAGIIPFIFGLVTLFFTWTSYLNPDAPFLAMMPPGSDASFTLNEVRQFNASLADELVTSKHVHYSILMAVGILIMTLSVFGLRQRLKWSWFVLVITILLVGWNDAVTALSFGNLPVPLVPAMLATIGLVLARKPIFSRT